MVFLSEQERLYAYEKNLKKDSSVYNIPVGTWNLAKDYGNITLSDAGFVIFNFEVCSAAPGYTVVGALFIGGKPVLVISTTGTSWVANGGVVWLPAGTYNVSVYGGGTYSTGYAGQIRNMQVGFTKFNDSVGYALQESSSATLQISSRKTPIGSFNKAVFAINASAYAPSGQTVTNITIKVDNVSQTPDEVVGVYQACHAKLFLPLSTGVNHTISIASNNANATNYLSVIACPWILPTASKNYDPFTFDFPPFSTIYVYLHYLFNDVTKNWYIGKTHGITYGASDYYKAVSGTGLLECSYTFECLNPSDVTMMVDGLGGCIENVGVDVR